MLPDQSNGARLRAFDALLLDKADLGADGQAIESSAENGVAVKIDLATLRRFNESTIFPGEEFRHSAAALRQVVLDLVVPDLAARIARYVFDLPHRRVEGLPNRSRACSRSGASPRVLVTMTSRCSGIAIRTSILKTSPCRCRVCGPAIAT